MLKKNYKNFEKTTTLRVNQFHPLIGCCTVSHFFRILKKSVFQRILKDTSAAHDIENFSKSATINEKVTYQVMRLTQKYNIVEKLMKN